MRIALIAPPFIAVPPKDYGGTELFIAQLAEGLHKTGVNVVVYANGESTVNECRPIIREELSSQVQRPELSMTCRGCGFSGVP